MNYKDVWLIVHLDCKDERVAMQLWYSLTLLFYKITFKLAVISMVQWNITWFTKNCKKILLGNSSFWWEFCREIACCTKTKPKNAPNVQILDMLVNTPWWIPSTMVIVSYLLYQNY